VTRDGALRLAAIIRNTEFGRYGRVDLIPWANGHFTLRFYDRWYPCHFTVDSPLAWEIHRRESSGVGAPVPDPAAVVEAAEAAFQAALEAMQAAMTELEQARASLRSPAGEQPAA
jgi:hypothetical protein